jgi:hypothetical protein
MIERSQADACGRAEELAAPFYTFRQHGAPYPGACILPMQLRGISVVGHTPSLASRAAPAPGRAGYAVDIASIRGGRVPVDPASLHGAHARTSAVRRFLEDGGRQLQGLGYYFSCALLTFNKCLLT